MSALMPVRVLDRQPETNVQVNALENEIGTFSPCSALPRDTLDVWFTRTDLTENALVQSIFVDDEERARRSRYQLPSLGRLWPNWR